MTIWNVLCNCVSCCWSHPTHLSQVDCGVEEPGRDEGGHEAVGEVSVGVGGQVEGAGGQKGEDVLQVVEVRPAETLNVRVAQVNPGAQEGSVRRPARGKKRSSSCSF